MNIAIIPARGGSKRIPRKNIRSFCGRPMIAWPIAAAKASDLFDHVLVSTDDEEIAGAARAAGAETPFLRPAELADDYTGTNDVIVHALQWAQGAGWAPDAACCVYATAAFVQPRDLIEARKLLAPDCDYVFPALRYGHPPQRGFLKGPKGAPELLQPEFQKTRTQDLQAVYHDAGQFYWGKADAWLEERPVFESRTRFVEVPPTRAWDIDNEEDWTIAEALFAAINGDAG